MAHPLVPLWGVAYIEFTLNISWHNNYGAVSDDVLGCVATDDTIEGVKQAYKDKDLDSYKQSVMPEAGGSTETAFPVGRDKEGTGEYAGEV